MNHTKARSGESPLPSNADLQSRIVVLEIVSITALALAMDTSDNADVDQARGIASLILDTVRQRCDEMELNETTKLSACSYADELLSTALLSLYPDGKRPA